MIVSLAKECHLYVVWTTEVLALILVSMYPHQRKTVSCFTRFYFNCLYSVS